MTDMEEKDPEEMAMIEILDEVISVLETEIRREAVLFRINTACLVILFLVSVYILAFV